MHRQQTALTHIQHTSNSSIACTTTQRRQNIQRRPQDDSLSLWLLAAQMYALKSHSHATLLCKYLYTCIRIKQHQLEIFMQPVKKTAHAQSHNIIFAHKICTIQFWTEYQLSGIYVAIAKGVQIWMIARKKQQNLNKWLLFIYCWLMFVTERIKRTTWHINYSVKNQTYFHHTLKPSYKSWKWLRILLNALRPLKILINVKQTPF